MVNETRCGCWHMMLQLSVHSLSLLCFTTSQCGLTVLFCRTLLTFQKHSLVELHYNCLDRHFSTRNCQYWCRYGVIHISGIRPIYDIGPIPNSGLHISGLRESSITAADQETGVTHSVFVTPFPADQCRGDFTACLFLSVLPTITHTIGMYTAIAAVYTNMRY